MLGNNRQQRGCKARNFWTAEISSHTNGFQRGVALMATRAIDFAERGVSVGRVFDRAFRAIRHQPLAMLVIVLLFTAAPIAGGQYLIGLLPWFAMVMTIGSFAVPGFFAAALARWFLGLVVGTVSQGAMTRPVIAEEEGRKASIGESLAAAGSALFPLFLMGALVGVAVMIGTTLLIVPGVIVYLLWSVAASAQADERDGVFLSLSRSQELTEGARWKVFAILLILLGTSILVGIAMTVVRLVLLRMELVGSVNINDLNGYMMVTLAIQTVAAAVLNLVWGSVQASLYVELKEWKEGGSVESLEQVFA